MRGTPGSHEPGPGRISVSDDRQATPGRVVSLKPGRWSLLGIWLLVLWISLPGKAFAQEAASGAAEKPFTMLAFDFGSDELDQVMPGWIGVSEKDFYTKARGFGWKTHLEPQPPELVRKIREITGYSEAQVAAITHFSRGEIMKMAKFGKPLLGWYNNRLSRPDRYNQAWGVAIEELDTLLDRDYVRGERIFGFYYDPRIRQECLETRGAIFIDDDLSTEFLVDLPNGDYTLLIGMGDNKHAHYRLSPWHVEAEGQIRLRECAPRSLVRRRIEDVQVRDGQLNLRIFVDRNQAMTHPWPWNTFAAWSLNYLVVFPAKETEKIVAREEEIERQHYEHLKQVVFVGGERTESTIRDGCLVVNDKPLFQISVHNFPGVQKGFPNDLKYYPYYCFANTIGIQVERILSSAHFMQSRWQERSYYDDYPFMTIGRMNDCYRGNFLVRLATAQRFLAFMPRYLQHESATMEDSVGNSLGRAPLNSELQRELTREAYIMLSAHLRDHPAHIGYEIWDEMPHMGVRFGHDAKSVAEYRRYLEEKYDDLGTLNAEWKTVFQSFDEIVPPGQHEPTANFVNFYRFISRCMTDQVIETHDVLKKLEPWHTTHGGKGQGTGVEDNSWYRVPAAEVLRVEIAPNVGRAACEHFGHALEAGQGDPGCKWAYYYPGVKRLGERKPPEKRYTGVASQTSGYSFVLRKIFDGVKSNWWEEYNDAASHAFHRTKVARELAGKGRIRRWTGELVFFDEASYANADICVCPGFLELARAHQLAYRLGPLFLPAKPPKSEVAVVMTWNSFIPIGRHRDAYRCLADHTDLDEVLKSIQVPHDVLREPVFDRIADYKVVILGAYTWALTPEHSRKLAEFSAKGGTLVFLDDAATGDARSLTESDTFPVHDDLKRAAGFSRTGRTWTLPGGAKVSIGSPQNPQALRSTDGRTWWIDFQGLYRSDRAALRNVLSDAIRSTKVQPTLSLSADREPETIDADVLLGRDVALVGVSTICQQDQRITLRMHFLQPGRWDVVDVTGELPKTRTDEFGSGHLVPDPDNRYARFVAKDVTAEDLAATGVKLDVQARAGRVLAVRPAAAKVWVNAPDYEIRGILLQERRFRQRAEKLTVTIVPVRIVTSESPSPALTQAAGRIAKLLRDAGVEASVVKPSEVGTRARKIDVMIQHDGGDPRADAEKYLVDTFDCELIDGDTHLVCLGSEATNPIIRHLGKVGAFTYDKVLEKVTGAFPDAGRGIIQVVDSVNHPTLDPRHSTRDAVLVGGSDEAGTLAAAEKLCDLLKPPDRKEARP